jgi:hypothetical protein
MCSARGVLKLVLAHHLFHPIFQMKFEFFQTMLLELVYNRKHMLVFEFVQQPVVLMMLVHQFPKVLVRLHEMRFDFVLSVPVHYWHFSSSGVASPCRVERLSGPVGSFTSF